MALDGLRRDLDPEEHDADRQPDDRDGDRGQKGHLDDIEACHRGADEPHGDHCDRYADDDSRVAAHDTQASLRP